MTAPGASSAPEAPLCVCGRPKGYHTDQPAAPGAPWHPYTIPTGRHERGCLVISGPHDAALCRSLWDDSDGGKQRRCGYTQRHPSHTFMRLEVLFQCPGADGMECLCASGSPEMYEGPLRDCPIHGEHGTEGER